MGQPGEKEAQGKHYCFLLIPERDFFGGENGGVGPLSEKANLLKANHEERWFLNVDFLRLPVFC